MPIQQQYQPFVAEFQKVQTRLVAILSENNPAFTGRMKAEKLANAHRYFSNVMTALEIFAQKEDASGFEGPDAEIDSPLIPPPEPEPEA